MLDLSLYNVNSPANPDAGIFGLPFSYDNSLLILLPVPWEVTVSYGAGTSRAPDHIMDASMQVDVLDQDFPECWKEGIFMHKPDKTLLMKSDFLRKEAELYINFISKGEEIEKNKFMCKSLRDINEGSAFLNGWVYDKVKKELDNNKLVGLLGGDHSTPLGMYKALAEKHPSYGILHIDAHCDLRKGYENFKYSHASVMYNALEQIPAIEKVVQVGIRDFCEEEQEYMNANPERIKSYFDRQIASDLYEGKSWKQICDEIVNELPTKVHLSFDVDGLDPKLCPATGTPVPGGFEAEQVLYLIKQVLKSGRELISFDLVEVGVSENDWDANVGARILFRLCNMLIHSYKTGTE